MIDRLLWGLNKLLYLVIMGISLLYPYSPIMVYYGYYGYYGYMGTGYHWLLRFIIMVIR